MACGLRLLPDVGSNLEFRAAWSSQQPADSSSGSATGTRTASAVCAGANKTFFSFFITGHYLGVLLVFFWSPVTGSKEQRSAKRRPAPGAPRPARRTLPAGCRAAAWPAACAQSLSSPAFDHEPLSSKWAAAEEEALPQAEVARRRYVRGPQSLPRRLGPVGGGLIEQGGGMGKMATRGGVGNPWGQPCWDSSLTEETPQKCCQIVVPTPIHPRCTHPVWFKWPSRHPDARFAPR